MNALSVGLQSGSILLHEGLEALLAIAALAAFLNRVGVSDKVRSLYIGGGFAILASIGAAAAFEMFFEGNHNDYMEAAVLAIAAILMLYMSRWMYLRQDPRTWIKELRGHAERALNSGVDICAHAYPAAMPCSKIRLWRRNASVITLETALMRAARRMS